MTPVVGVGGSFVPGTSHDDVWAPVLVLACLVLVRVIGGLGITWRTTLVSIVGGVAWAWLLEPWGLMTTSAFAILIAFVSGSLVRRVDAAARRRSP